MPFSAPLLAAGILLLVSGLILGAFGTDLLDNGGGGTAQAPEISVTSSEVGATASTASAGSTSGAPSSGVDSTASTVTASAAVSTTSTVSAASTTSPLAATTTTTTTDLGGVVGNGSTEGPSHPDADAPAPSPSPSPSREFLPVSQPQVVG